MPNPWYQRAPAWGWCSCRRWGRGRRGEEGKEASVESSVCQKVPSKEEVWATLPLPRVLISQIPKQWAQRADHRDHQKAFASGWEELGPQKSNWRISAESESTAGTPVVSLLTYPRPANTLKHTYDLKCEATDHPTCTSAYPRANAICLVRIFRV